jgi:putative ABC transport system permease protein
MTYATLLARNFRRNRLRTLLTTASITLAVFLVCAVLTLPNGLSAIVDRMASNTRLSVHNKAGIAYLLPYSYLHKIRAVPGVAAATSFMWFGGIYDEPKNMFPNFAVDTEAVRAVWPDYAIDPQALADFERHRDAALVGYRTMRTFGWKVGDRVTLRGTAWPVDLDFRIVGEITKNPAWFLFSRVYLEEAVRAKGQSADVSGMMWVRVSSAEEVDGVTRRIDDLFRNSTAETASETEKSFFQSFMSSLSGLTRIIVAVGFLAVTAVVFIAANSSSMTIRERAAEIALLKALGFRRRTILTLLLGETMVLAVIGGTVGAFGAYGLLKLLAHLGATGARPGLGPLSMFEMNETIVAEGLLLSVAIGLVAGVIPSWGAARKPVAAAVREVF